MLKNIKFVISFNKKIPKIYKNLRHLKKRILIYNSKINKKYLFHIIYVSGEVHQFSLDQWSRRSRGKFIGCCCSAIAPSAAVRQVSGAPHVRTYTYVRYS